MLDTRRGKIAVGWLIVEDLACVLALVLIPALAERELAYSLAEMVMATPPYRPARVV